MVNMAKVVVACVNASGQADLVPYVVRCTDDQIDEGAHYVIATQAAEEDDYESPMVVFDHTDSHRGMFGLFDWSSSDIVVLDIVQGVTE